MSAIIRRVEARDVDAVFGCLRTYGFHLLGGPSADPDFPAGAVLSVRNAISHFDLRERCWLAEREGAVLGFCSWAWIDEAQGIAKTLLIVVLPAARSLGVGSLLQQRRMEEMRELGVGFVSLTEALDLTTPTGRAMAGLLAVFAEFEREILRERVHAGLAHARQNGKRLGRPPTAALNAKRVRQLFRAGISKAAIARQLQISRTSVRRILKPKK